MPTLRKPTLGGKTGAQGVASDRHGSCRRDATASAAACGASSGGDAPANGLVLYNGQHEQTTRRSSRVREADRRQGEGAQRRRGRARRADPARGIPVPGRRVLHREHPAARSAGRAAPALAGRPGHACRGAGRRTARPTTNWVGVSARVSVLVYNTNDAQAVPAADVDPRTWPTRNGRASSASRRSRPTSSRSSPRSRAPTAPLRPLPG